MKDCGVSIYRGILTGCNDAFIISGEKRKYLIEQDPKSAEIIRPILRGRDIKRYGYSFADMWLIATFPSRRYNIDDFTAIKDYLENFGKYDKAYLKEYGKDCWGKKRLGQTGENGARKKTNNKWFETQDSISYWDDFSKQKIVWGNLCLNAQYAFVEEQYFISAPATMIVPGDKFLLAVLNSKLADFYIRNLGVTRNGGYFEYKPMFVEKLPIPNLSSENKIQYINIMNEIISLRNKSCGTSRLEHEIDTMVYSMYQLSQEEISFLEG